MAPESPLAFLVMGTVFGLTAGISPGPLLTLVIKETIQHSRKEGVKVAIAPFITDLPIVALTLLIFAQLSAFNTILGLISCIGGLFVAYLGWETIRAKGFSVEQSSSSPQSLRKGLAANFLNPHAYLFWLTVGSPIAVQAYQVGLTSAVLFFLPFYFFLVGSKIAVAFLVHRSKAFITSKVYSWVMIVLGVTLWAFAVYFLVIGIGFLIN